MKSLFDSLQKEFCPPLDSSLIAALLAELESDAEGKAVSPSQDEIDNLFSTCSELALQADESQQSEFSESDFLQTSQIDETISSWTTDYNREQWSSGGSGSSCSSDSSQHSFASPLGFLQAALPDVPTTRLRRVLLHAEKEDIDMWDIVSGILTEQSILEMEERGLDRIQEGVSFFGGISFECQSVEPKKKPSTKAGKKKIHLNDIRQQYHTRPSPSSSTKATHGSSMKRPTVGVITDPWTQISSLSTYVASLLPPHPPSFFQSFFHSPKSGATSYDALRAALTSLCKNKQDPDNYNTIFSHLMNILLIDNADVDPELAARIIADIRLSVVVADGRAADAFDLVNVLRDLHTKPEMGLFHLLPAKVSDSKSPLLSDPLSISSPSQPKFKQKIKLPSVTPSEDKSSPYQWQTVPYRNTQRDSGMASLEEDDCERRMADATLRERELLQQATRMWQKGNSKTHGGEVAQHYAERSNQYLALAKKEALNLSRAKVQANMKQDLVDFHGVNVANATIIIQEIMEKQKSLISQAKPLRIITGRGNHSVNKKSVLKPALRKVLRDDGWLVVEWDAGLDVCGRRRATT